MPLGGETCFQTGHSCRHGVVIAFRVGSLRGLRVLYVDWRDGTLSIYDMFGHSSPILVAVVPMLGSEVEDPI